MRVATRRLEASSAWTRMLLQSSAVELALADAERKGFRLAVIGRTCALVADRLLLPGGSRVSEQHLRGGADPGDQLRSALRHSAWPAAAYERIGRYALFAFDAAAISAMLAFAPLSSGGDVPQNLVFLSSRTEYYYIVVAVSVLALSPALVLWTGFAPWSVSPVPRPGSWRGMERVVSLGDLPPSPSREEFFAVVLNPDFLGIPASA